MSAEANIYHTDLLPPPNSTISIVSDVGSISRLDQMLFTDSGLILTENPIQDLPNQEVPAPEIPTITSTPESTDEYEQTLNVSEINPLPSSVPYGRRLLPEFYREPNVEDYRLQTEEIGSYIIFSRTGTLKDNGENTVINEFSENTPIGISGILESITSNPDGSLLITISYPNNYIEGQETILFDQSFSFEIKPEDLEDGVLVNFNDTTPSVFENKDQVLWIGFIKDGIAHTEWLIDPLQESPNLRGR